MNKKLLGLLALATVAVGSAHAEVPTDITAIVTDAGTVWGTVKTFIVGVVAFMVLLRLAKLVSKR